MASYSLTTTAAQEAVITRARTEANAVQGATQYAANGPFLLDIVKDKIAEILGKQKDRDRASYEDKLAIATQAQKDAVAAALGLPAGTL